MSKPRNIIVIVADSLRYDVVDRGRALLPYIEANSVRFEAARSAGCWTLPATASMFTGLLPHEHGATAQTRGLRDDVPTLAERLSSAGYRTAQVTGNIATSDVFGLHRGFDEVRCIWNYVEPRYRLLDQLVVLAGKRRLRARLFSRDFIMGRMAGDFSNSKVWLQSTAADVFDQARNLLAEGARARKGSFLFLNLMETHFPYHVGLDFGLLGDGLWKKLREAMALYHLANQTWLATGKSHIRPDMLEVLRQRQRESWALVAPLIDEFVRELHQDTGNLVVFCSDHGDNFGEQGWLYHFSNVTDAGNRVPLYVLPHDGRAPGAVHTPVNARDLYGLLTHAAGLPEGRPLLWEEPERSQPILSSYWYNNHGKTRPEYRYNQLAFVHGGARYRHRLGRWARADVAEGWPEPEFEPLDVGANPIEDAGLAPEVRAEMRAHFGRFRAFSEQIGEGAPPK